MGGWSEYYEDFPEENPANWVNGEFNPQAAERLREQKSKLASEQSALDSTIAKMIAEGEERARNKKHGSS